MKTSLYLRIGLIMSVVYYLLDTVLDTVLFYKEASFLDLLILDIPLNELYNRFMAIILIVLALLLIRLFELQHKKSWRRKNRDPFEDLNRVNVVELVGHQLKTSLSTILGFTNLMNQKEINSNTRAMYGEYVYTSSTNLLGLFNNLMDLNRIAEKKYLVVTETCRVNKLLGELKNKYDADVARQWGKKLKIELNIPENTQHLLLTTDCRKLHKILSRLIENALSFTHAGIVEFGYTLEKENTIRFFVSDEGGDVSMEQLEEIFRDYFMQQENHDAPFSLDAMRLMVARKFSELIGGKVWSEMQDGAGSVYYFSLPLEEQEVEQVTEKPADKKKPDWSDKNILIAEDVEPNYLLLAELLKPTRANLVWAKDGGEAVDYFTEHGGEVDLILMDIVMPGMDGFEAAQKIKEMNPVIPVVGQTAYSLEYEKNPDQLKNFNDYVTKPIWYHELLNILSKYL